MTRLSKVQFFTATIVSACLLLASCDGKDATAVAICPSVLAFRSSDGLGYVNTPRFNLGDVFYVNTSTMIAGNVLGNMNFPVGDADAVAVDSSYQMALATELKFNFSANVDESVKASLQSAISANTQVNATNLKRLNAGSKSDNGATGFADYLSQNPHKLDTTIGQLHSSDLGKIRLAVVTSVFYASDFSLSEVHGSTTSANVSVVKIGDFNVSVDYSCDSSLKQHGDVRPFYKVTFLTIDPVTKQVSIDVDANIDLTKYDFTNAIM